MENALARARCSACGNGIPFEDWRNGAKLCAACARGPRMPGPAATYVRGPVRAESASASEAALYERILDDMPDELVDELVAALEAEVERIEQENAAPKTAVREVLHEIGFNRSPREWHWAAWGFAGGFALNVALAKYAQIASGAGMSEFAGPLLLGGMAAGLACGAIGWGLAKLRD